MVKTSFDHFWANPATVAHILAHTVAHILAINLLVTKAMFGLRLENRVGLKVVKTGFDHKVVLTWFKPGKTRFKPVKTGQKPLFGNKGTALKSYIQQE